MARKPTETPAARPRIAIVDENGKPVETIEAGDALVLRAEGLHPSTRYTVTLADDVEIAGLGLVGEMELVGVVPDVTSAGDDGEAVFCGSGGTVDGGAAYVCALQWC